MEKNTKAYEDKNIVEKFTMEDKFNLAGALLKLEAVDKNQEERLLGLEEAMMFFSEWYNKTQRKDILLPDTSNPDGSSKIILPNG